MHHLWMPPWYISFVSFWLINVGNRPRVNNGAIQFLPLLEKSLIKTKRLWFITYSIASNSGRGQLRLQAGNKRNKTAPISRQEVFIWKTPDIKWTGCEEFIWLWIHLSQYIYCPSLLLWNANIAVSNEADINSIIFDLYTLFISYRLSVASVDGDTETWDTAQARRRVRRTLRGSESLNSSIKTERILKSK